MGPGELTPAGELRKNLASGEADKEKGLFLGWAPRDGDGDVASEEGEPMLRLQRLLELLERGGEVVEVVGASGLLADRPMI
jgi:hypothetical protein